MTIRLMLRPIRATHTRSDDRRRTLYRNDPNFRANWKKQSRLAYQRNNNVELSDCLYSLSFYEHLARKLKVRTPAGNVVEYPVFSLNSTAGVLQKRYQTVWRWLQKKMIPAPVLQTIGQPGKPFCVYHQHEVRVLIEEIGKHEREIVYFRSDHTEVRERIEQRIAEVRKALGY